MSREEVFSKVSGFIDKDTEITGDIRFKESFRIDGKIKGNILSGSSLIIGEFGDVNGEIKVENVSINGNVKGTVEAKNRVEIFSNGRVTGKIVSPKLIIEEGAFFQGSSQMELKALEGKQKDEPEKKENKEEKPEKPEPKKSFYKT